MSFFSGKGERAKVSGRDIARDLQPKMFLRNSGEFNLYDTAGIDKSLKDLEGYTSSLDLLTVCFHGVGQSRKLIEQVQDYSDEDIVIKSTNIGIAGLASKIPARFTREGVQGTEIQMLNTFIARLTFALAKAKRIAIFVDESDLNTALQRDIYAALMKAAQASGTKVFNVKNGKNFGPLFQSLDLI